MKKVSVILADGFEEIEALTVVDLLRRAQIYVGTVSITDDYTVHGAHGINVQAEDLFEEVAFGESDMIVLPGGMPGTSNLNAHEGVRRVVKEFNRDGKYIGAICAAPTILGNLGLLKGKRVSCYPSVEQEIQGAVMTRTDVTVDGNLITSRGAGTAIAFALKLIEMLFGAEKAAEIAEAILYE
ncbi:MAG: DJ-1 family glyoxalase III [Dorea phocaeensis]